MLCTATIFPKLQIITLLCNNFYRLYTILKNPKHYDFKFTVSNKDKRYNYPPNFVQLGNDDEK